MATQIGEIIAMALSERCHDCKPFKINTLREGAVRLR